MKSKTIVLLVAAIGCGLVASYMTSQLLAQKEAPKEDDDLKVKVLVAKQNIQFGQKFDDPEKFFTFKAYKPGDEPKKALQTFEELKDRRANRTITAESFITKDDLMNDAMSFLQQKLPPGTRAVTIRVTAESSTAGFVLPDSRVDVLWTGSGGPNEDAQTKTLLEDMLVLAVDGLDRRPDDRNSVVGGTLTLQATPYQAEFLTHAQANGSLRFLLRPFGDKERVQGGGVRTKNLTAGSQGGNQEQPGDNGTPGSTGTIANATPKTPAPEVKPVTPIPQPEVVPVPEPKYTKFIQKIRNGNQWITVVRLLDEDGELIEEPVKKTELENQDAVKQ